MNRKGKGDDGDGNDDSSRHHNKRQRWNGGEAAVIKNKNDGGGGTNNKMDLVEKTQGENDDGYYYGYPSSSDDDDDADHLKNNSGGGGKKKKTKSLARKEQRLGLRSFRTTDTENNNDDNDDVDGNAKKNDAVLPTPRGWAHLTKKDNDNKNNKLLGSRINTPRHRPPTESSGFTLSSAPPRANNQKSSTTYTNNNPYANNNNNKSSSKTPAAARRSSSSIPSTTRTSRSNNKHRTSHHVVCAVSENLARETCVSYLDASRPTYLHITKQGNGQTYGETMSLLRMLNPHEILLNEGRKNSLLATKIMTLFGQQQDEYGGMDHSMMMMVGGKKKKKNNNNNGRGKKKGRFVNNNNTNNNNDDDDDIITMTNNNNSSGSSAACETTTVIKFIPRSYFDQTKGAELLRKLAREGTYDASLVEEYILLSSSYAVLQYAQLCLGAGLTRGSLSLDVNVGGNHRMNIDRSTMVNLELLVNAKTGRPRNSLLGTIDCTKTSVGSRLLRTNLMAPPTRMDTINARLDLVDSLLEDEEFFYVVMEHLEDLPDVDKMLSYVALAPRKRGFNNSKNNNTTGNNGGALFGNTERQTVTARIASKGISALVCIKSTLSVIPSFAHVLDVQLKELDEREGISSSSSRAAASSSNQQGNQNDISRQQRQREERSVRRNEDDESSTIIESETSQNGEDTLDTTTQDGSLQIGLGSARKNSTVPLSNKQSRHQLLRAILIAMKQPALTRVLNAVTDIFTESTTYSKNSHAMRHQECFALKPNTDGMMDVLRKA